MSDPAHLNGDATRQLAAITASCPELAIVQAHVQAFAQIMTERRGRDLEKWMTAADAAPGLRR